MTVNAPRRSSRLRALLAASIVMTLFTPGRSAAVLSAQAPVDVSVAAYLGTEVTDVGLQPGGGFVVVWQKDTGHPNYSSDVRARVFDADGAPVSDVIAMGGASTGAQFAPSLAIASDGDFLVAWQGSSGIHTRRFHADGAPAGVAFEVPGSQGGHRVSATQDRDGYALAWVAFDGVRVSRLDADGDVRDVHSQVLSDVQRVAVRGMHGGRLLLAWSRSWHAGLTHDSEGPVGFVDAVVLSSANDVLEELRANQGRYESSYPYVVDGETGLFAAASATGV